MFDPSPIPRLFGLPPGADFPAELVAGLRSRMAGKPPEAMAQVEVFVNTGRMQRRLREAFARDGAGFLPRIRLVTDLGQDMALADLPPPVPPLRRRLELTTLVAALLDRQPDLAPRSSLYDLADSLAALMDEMQGEGVTPAALAALDLSSQSDHWARSLAFIAIVGRYFGDRQAEAPDTEPPDTGARQRLVVEHLARAWQTDPPQHPVLVAGSTGSRGATRGFMQAVARLPQGAIVLPGFDFGTPATVWESLTDAMTAEDHPQYRFLALAAGLGLHPDAIIPWTTAPPPSPDRNRLVSLSLRPAPVTDQWMIEGRDLGDLAAACADMTLIEAPSPRAEALAIALLLREAAETGTRAALITPDRGLSRQVTAALDRWAILPDDSAGQPLPLSPEGRLMRQVAALFGRRLTAEALLALLKHPLVASGDGRGAHLTHTRALELRLRRHGPAFPGDADLLRWAGAQPEPDAPIWAQWLAGLLAGVEAVGTRPLTDHLAHHMAIVTGLARGPRGSETGRLWREAPGAEALACVAELVQEAPAGGSLAPGDYANLFTAVLQRRQTRGSGQGHPHLMIWGTREARVQGAELVILGGLNDGIWPPLPPPDPWLNRQMRHDAGLLLPERQIGLSAHDYQQAMGARRVVLSRSVRSAEAPTTASRWLNRLVNLMGGLPGQGGPAALGQMRARGQIWLDQAALLDAPTGPAAPEPRPAPCPPVAARPAQLAVTGIRTLIRDPYAIYARHVLRLSPLDPLRPRPDPRLRGSVLHLIVERFIRERGAETPVEGQVRLMQIADAVLLAEIPWPAARRLWRARLERVAGWFIAAEAARPGTPALIERRGSLPLAPPGFTLTAKPDRIDILEDGALHILDYKTSAPPTQAEVRQSEKQLLLEAMMAERGAFAALGPRRVDRVTYIGLGTSPKELPTPVTPELTAQTLTELVALITRYQDPEQGYTSRRVVANARFDGDYDHLARFGEWEQTDAPVPVPVP